MALSGTLQSNQYSGSGGKRGIQLNWSATQNVANNTSTISWSLTSNGTTSATYWYESGNFKVIIDGQTVYSSATRIRLTQGMTIASGTKTITHNADGTRSFSAHIEAGIYTTAVNCRGDGSWALNTIPRASQPTIAMIDPDMGHPITIYTNRASSAFTHTITYQFGNASGTIGTNVGSEITWTPSVDLANQIPNTTSGSGVITCTTFNGSTNIGSKTVAFTLSVPASVVPSISSVVVSDPNNYANTFGGYVQSKSKVKVQVGAAGSYGSSITKYSITANGWNSAENGQDFGVIGEGAGTKTVYVTVTDSRGRTASSSATYSVIGYQSPTITKLSASRCDATGKNDDSGDHIKITYAGSITPLNNHNAKQLLLRYRSQDELDYTTIDQSSEYSKDSIAIIPADINKSFVIYWAVADSFSTNEQIWNVSTAFSLMDFRHTGKGIAFGKVSEKDAIEFNMPIYIGTMTLEEYIRSVR